MSGGSSGEPPGIVKYGASWPKMPGKRLARFPWGSQDGAAAMKEEEWPLLQRREATTWPVPATHVQVSPRVQRDRTTRRGREDDCRSSADRALDEGGEPSLTQIMATIQGCQNKLIDRFEELQVEFSFMK